MKVWIDQDLCTGDGLCEEICPAIFQMHDDGLAYVKEAHWDTIFGPNYQTRPVYRMADGLATVPDGELENAIDAADECPGECIYLEVDG